MPDYLLEHRHTANECAAAFAAWRGFASPLRGEEVQCTCLAGEHALRWRVAADHPDAALALLPRYVAERTEIVEVRDVVIP